MSALSHSELFGPSCDIVAGSLICTENQGKPATCCNSRINFATYIVVEYTSPCAGIKLQAVLAMSTDCKARCTPDNDHNEDGIYSRSHLDVHPTTITTRTESTHALTSMYTRQRSQRGRNLLTLSPRCTPDNLTITTRTESTHALTSITMFREENVVAVTVVAVGYK
jgi:hypothetical protein